MCERCSLVRFTLHQVLKFSISLSLFPPFLSSGAHSLMPFNAIYNSLPLQAVHMTGLVKWQGVENSLRTWKKEHCLGLVSIIIEVAASLVSGAVSLPLNWVCCLDSHHLLLPPASLETISLPPPLSPQRSFFLSRFEYQALSERRKGS